MLWCACPDQGADLCDIGLALSGSQQAVVADAMKAVGQDMHQEPADELVRVESHDLHTIAAPDPIVFPSERHGVGIGADEALVRDRNTVRVTTEVGQNCLGAAERWFGVNDPFGFAERRKPYGEGFSVRQLGQVTEEGQLSGAMKRHQSFHKQAAKQTRQHPDMQEESGLAGHPFGAVRRQPAAGYDHVYVGVVRERRAPSVQYAGDADAGAEALGIGGNGHHCFRRGAKQQAIDRPFVPEGDPRDLGWQCEDGVEILDWQQVFGTGCHPVASGRALALGAVPVLATIIGDMLVATLGAGRYMPAERICSAGFYRRHHLELAQADMPCIGPPPRGTMLAEYVSNLQPCAGQGPRLTPVASCGFAGSVA